MVKIPEKEFCRSQDCAEKNCERRFSVESATKAMLEGKNIIVYDMSVVCKKYMQYWCRKEREIS